MTRNEPDLADDLIGMEPLAETAGSGRRKVLIVDDDPDFAASLAGLLRLESYEVLVAHDPATALSMLDDERVAVVLVDVRLGTGSGVDLVHDIRQRDPDLVCVMITAYASVDTAVEALQAGAYDYLCKPFHSEDLLATLERCIERTRLIEAKRRAAERLGQKQRLEAMGQLTRGIAHEFNNVLAVIYANLRWLEEQLEDRPDLAGLARDALDATRSGNELSDRLLRFGRQYGEPTVLVDLGVELPPLARMLARTLGTTINLSLEVEDALAPVEIPAGQLEPSLLNLALNARDAMPGGGSIAITARTTLIAPEDARVASGLLPGSYVLLAVRDSGQGMPLAVRRRALEPMFTTKPPGQGSGLGLAMVDGFVRQAGGRLELRSAPGEGTVVSLYLPVRQCSDGGTNI